VGITAKLHFVDPKAEVDVWRQLALLVPLSETTLDLDFRACAAIHPARLGGASHDPRPGSAFLPLPRHAPSAKQLTAWKKSFVTHLYQNERVELLACPPLKVVARADESPAAFQARVDQLARERRDEEVQALRAKYDPKFQQMQAKLDALGAKLQAERAEVTAKQVDTAAAFGNAFLGAIMGRSVVSGANVRRGASAVRSAGRVQKEAGDVARAEEQLAALHEKWAALQAEANAKLAALQSRAPGVGLVLTRSQLAPRKADTDLGTLALVWLPFRRDASGHSTFAFDWR
jgi:hypothetical protein